MFAKSLKNCGVIVELWEHEKMCQTRRCICVEFYCVVSEKRRGSKRNYFGRYCRVIEKGPKSEKKVSSRTSEDPYRS